METKTAPFFGRGRLGREKTRREMRHILYLYVA